MHTCRRECVGLYVWYGCINRSLDLYVCDTEYSCIYTSSGMEVYTVYLSVDICMSGSVDILII